MDSLRQHAISKVKDPNHVICQYCFKIFVTRERLQQHISSGLHKPSKPVSSQHKQVPAIESTNSAAHRPQQATRMIRECADCGQVFQNGALLRTHVYKEHQRRILPSELKGIQEAPVQLDHLDELERALKDCEICGQSYLSGHQLQKHVVATHPSLKCPTCPKAFTAEPYLEQHSISTGHTADSQRSGRQPTDLASQEQRPDVNTLAVARNTSTTGTPAAHPDIIAIMDRISKIEEAILALMRSSDRKVQVAEKRPAEEPGSALDSAAVSINKTPWSTLTAEEQELAFHLLEMNCISHDDLKKQGYSLQVYKRSDLDQFRKCCRCFGKEDNKRQQKHTDGSAGTQRALEKKDTPCRWHLTPETVEDSETGRELWKCCGKTDKGCNQSPSHVYDPVDWRLVKKYRNFSVTPAVTILDVTKRRAVAIDCEMGGIPGGINELIKFCAVDYLTGEILIDKLVAPSVRIIDWRTRYSGVSRKDMEAAIADGTALNGWSAAREELWKYIDSSTIIVGHAANNDLDALKMIHHRVVDSLILARNVCCTNQDWGLKKLCKEFIGLDVQTAGKKGHDCKEDTLAARELVLWCTRNKEAFNVWGRERKIEYDERKRLQDEKQQAKEELRLAKLLQKKAELGTNPTSETLITEEMSALGVVVDASATAQHTELEQVQAITEATVSAEEIEGDLEEGEIADGVGLEGITGKDKRDDLVTESDSDNESAGVDLIDFTEEAGGPLASL